MKERGVIAMTLEKTEERKRSECRGDWEREREGGTFQRKKEKSEYTVQPRGKRRKGIVKD